MQTSNFRGTGTDVSRSHRGRSGNKSFNRRPKCTKNPARRQVCRSSFLNQKCPIIPAKPDVCMVFADESHSEENFDFLAECAVHYAELLGKTLELPSGTVQEKICLLYHRFAAILPEYQELNIELSEGRLMWVIYRFHDWNEHIFYWMPLKFITLLSGKIREIAASFMHLFIHRNGLNRFKEGYEFDFFFECTEENLHYYYGEDSEKQEYMDLLHSYFNGEISAFLDEIYDHKPVDVVRALSEYHPENPLEAKLLDCFRQGLPFISGNRIMAYNYDPYMESYSDEYEDTSPITLDRIIRYVYDLNDYVTRELDGMTNQYMQEVYAMQPTSSLILSPDSKLFMVDDYPERFSEWFLKMLHITEQIIDHE